MSERKFDWAPHYDPRNAYYPARSLGLAQPPERKRLWAAPFERLDQGKEGACVGFAWTIALRSGPVHAPINPRVYNEYAVTFYREAQFVDMWTGEDYEGTSVLAGAKIAKERGLITNYYWVTSISGMLHAIAHGPVILGTWWYSGMYQTGPGGLVHVEGDRVGGHAIAITGYEPKKKFDHKNSYDVFRWRNSWGPNYGDNGDGYIKVQDLEKLLADGEACVPVQEPRLFDFGRSVGGNEWERRPDGSYVSYSGAPQLNQNIEF